MLVHKSFPANDSISNLIASADMEVGKNKGNRVRISDTSGNVTAGGPGSGNSTNHPARGGANGTQESMHEYLRSRGYTQINTGKDGSTFWSRREGTSALNDSSSSGSINHLVSVRPNGSWDHSVEGLHSGTTVDSLKMAASSKRGTTGSGLKSLMMSIQAKEFSDEKRKSLAKQHKAEPNGSYPIENKGDLKRAKQAFGRSKNKAKTRSWINKRAKELGEKKMGANKLKAGGPGSGRRAEVFHPGESEPDFVNIEKHEPNKNAPKFPESKRFDQRGHPGGMFSAKKKRAKAMGEANLDNKKINKYMERVSAGIQRKLGK